VKQRVKQALTRVGASFPAVGLRALNGAVNYLEVGKWMRAHGFEPGRRFESREDLFREIAEAVGDHAVLYLEFGVHEGESMRTWTRLLRHPESALHGFDSFEGLPERWSHEEGVGHFSTQGHVPTFDDPRVQIFPGWFDQTLPSYDPPRKERLIVAVDSDLYSSAALVLDTLSERIAPGTFLYFDEFHDRAHELRAFSDFLERTGYTFRLFGATRELTHVAFVREA
jgi:hypothetical protein